MKKRGNKAQVTIFVVLGLIILIGVVLFFAFRGGIKINPSAGFDPTSYIETCAEDEILKTVDVLLENGGALNPKQTLMYQDHNYNYLCYAADTAQYCENKYPMLKSYVEQQIIKGTREKINACFAAMKKEAETRGFKVKDSGNARYTIELIPKNIIGKIEREIVLTRDGQSTKIQNFEIRAHSPIYDLIEIVQAIVNDEAQDCYTQYDIFMRNFLEISIYRISYLGMRIYELTDRESGKIFKFAVRSCELRGSY